VEIAEDNDDLGSVRLEMIRPRRVERDQQNRRAVRSVEPDGVVRTLRFTLRAGNEAWEAPRPVKTLIWDAHQAQRV